MDQPNPTFAKIPILDTRKFEQWKFKIQQYLHNEHYALWEVIEFGDSYRAEGSETLEQTFNKLQAIVSHLEFMDVEIKQDDLNHKFLTSLAPEWLMYTIVWRNRDDPDTMSLDDMYNYLKVGKGEVHTASVPTASTQVSTASTDVAAASISHDTVYIKWNMALLSMRADRFWKRTGKKITIQGSDVAGFDKSKDWSYMANKEENHALVADDEAPTEFTLMAKSCSSSENEVYDDSYCSKSCRKNTKNLNTKISKVNEELSDYENTSYHYKIGVSQVESRLVEFKTQEIKFCEKIRGLERDVKHIQMLEGLFKENQQLELNLEFQGFPLLIWETREKLLRPQLVGFGDLNKTLLKKNNINDKGYWDSGCSRHMTGNISYLSEYEPYDGGYVLFGQGGGKITGKGIIKTVVTDDFSRFTWTFFLRTKDETGSILRNFITKLENLKDLKVKIIRCDNGDEFKNIEMNEFCTKKGIKREFSNARTPQQNRVAERRNKTLIEAARTMLADAKLPVTFLAKAVNTAYHLGKFDAKGDEGYFIGYFMSSKAFRVFNKRTKKVEENIHWLLQEHLLLTFQFHKDHMESSNSDAQDSCNSDIPESSGISNPTATSKTPQLNKRMVQDSSQKGLIVKKKHYLLDNALTLSNRFEDSIGVEADISNMESSIPASPIPTFRIHKDHPKSQIIGPVDTPVQTKHKSKEEPKKIFDALKDLRIRLVGTKWVLKNKKDKRGIMIRNKARLVAQGHTQEEGIDYEEVFAPIARIKAIRLFLAYASFMGFTVYQMDVKSVFLYVTIDEEAPRAWYDTLSKYLLDNGFQMGELTFFLGLQILQKKDGIFLSQDKYVGDILKKFGYSYVRSANTPMDKENPWGKDGLGKDVKLQLYRSMIGSLMYLTASRPDIMFAICDCARHQVTPKECHLHAVKRIFRYLKGHPKMGLWYPKESPIDLLAYSDSDYGSASQDRKSTTRDDNVSDLLTKPFDVGRFQYLVGEGSAIPTEPHHIPSPQEQHSPHHDPSSPSHPTTTTKPIPQTPTDTLTETATIRQYSRRATRIAQSKDLSPTADEPTSLLRDDSQGQAFPTGSMQQKLKELMDLCTGLQRQENQIAAKIQAQDLEISGLKAMVKLLEEKDRGKEMVNLLSSMEAANILTSGVTAVSVSHVVAATTVSVSTVGVTTISGIFPTVSVIFTTASMVTPYSRRPREISAKDKGKEKVVESKEPKKKKLQE
nr:hypothetical protein [Tanacetum cinerariifolium]